MALQHMLHDGQPQASAARFAGAAAVHAIEALCQTRNVLWRNARARVAHGKPRRSIMGPLPGHSDGATRRCVAKRVADEIGQRTLQLCWNASDLSQRTLLFGGWEFQHMRARLALYEQCRQPTRLVLAALHQRQHGRPFSHARQRAAFQPG